MTAGIGPAAPPPRAAKPKGYPMTSLTAKIAAARLALETAETRMRYAMTDAETVNRMNLVARLRRELRRLEMALTR